jgi:hypothetical protein
LASSLVRCKRPPLQPAGDEMNGGDADEFAGEESACMADPLIAADAAKLEAERQTHGNESLSVLQDVSPRHLSSHARRRDCGQAAVEGPHSAASTLV